MLSFIEHLMCPEIVVSFYIHLFLKISYRMSSIIMLIRRKEQLNQQFLNNWPERTICTLDLNQ
jgi:hypothetical protein